MTLLLVADDLTGAADACAKFVARGFSGDVMLARRDEEPTTGRAAAPAPAPAPVPLAAPASGIVEAVEAVEAAATIAPVDVLAINTETRRLGESEARRRVHAASRLADHRRPSVIFKKVDSTLRGHVGIELEAAMEAFGCTHAIVAPAFPAMGRTVRDGMLTVDGAGTRPPPDVAALLAAQGVRGCVTIGSAGASVDTADATSMLRESIERALARGARVLVCDAISQADLEAIVSAASTTSQVKGCPLWVGSAGLAEALAGWLAERHPPVVPTVRIAARGDRVVLFIGSTNPITRGQQAHLLGGRGVAAVVNSHTRGAAADVREALDRGRHALIVIEWFRLERGGGSGALRNLIDAATHQALAGFVMSGGDTAAHVCAAMGAHAVRIGGEVANGVPWGVLRGGLADGVPLVFKSGGFGGRDALRTAVDFLARLGDRHVHT